MQPVFPGDDRQELLKRISFEEPRKLRRLNRYVRPELETIVLKGLEKNPAHRFDTAKHLADDLRRFLDNRPIRARPPTLLQRIGKLASRNTQLVTSAACLLVLAAIGLLISNFVIRDEREQFARVADSLTQVLEAQPNNSRAVRTRAWARLAMFDFDGAIDDLKVDAQANPQDPSLLASIGSIYAYLEDKQAIEYLERAVELSAETGVMNGDLP